MIEMSVVIPTHGRVDLFKETLQCLRNQTLQGFEIIVTDDSPDANDRELIKASMDKFKKRGVKTKYIFTKPNLLQAKNTNQGLAAASGKYMRILHSDDLLSPRCLSEEVGIFERNPDIDFFYHKPIQFQTNIAFSDKSAETNKVDVRIWLNKYIFVMTALPSCIVFRNDLYKRVGGMNEKYKFLCDWQLFFEFLLDSYKNGKQTMNIDRGYVGWRMHTNSVSGTMALAHFYEHTDFIKKLKSIYRSEWLLPAKQLKQNLIAAENYRYERILKDYEQYRNFALPQIANRIKNRHIWLDIKGRMKIVLHPIKATLRWFRQPFVILFLLTKYFVKR
jgi:glycosyltransferase involved in cell wall biosynthesis